MKIKLQPQVMLGVKVKRAGSDEWEDHGAVPAVVLKAPEQPAPADTEVAKKEE